VIEYNNKEFQWYMLKQVSRDDDDDKERGNIQKSFDVILSDNYNRDLLFYFMQMKCYNNNYKKKKQKKKKKLINY